MLGAQNDTLERARRTMQETEAVALEITEELGQNREKLISAHGRVREVQGLTGRARRILTSMSQRAVQQKMILYAVAIGLCLAFVILIWSMWRWESKKKKHVASNIIIYYNRLAWYNAYTRSGEPVGMKVYFAITVKDE